MKQARIFAIPALALALSPLLVACTGAAGQPELTAAQIVQKVRDTAKTVTSVQSTVDLSVTINKEGIKTLVAGLIPTTSSATAGKGQDWLTKLPDNASATLTYWRQSPDKLRVEVDSASFPNAKGDVLVYDGQKAYALDAAKNTVYIATPSNFADKIPDQMKTMMASMDAEQTVDKVIAASDITLAGTEQVAGVDAYKLTVTPKADVASLLGIPQQFQTQAGVLIKDLKATLWVGKDNYVPLKMTVEHPNIGSFTYSASNLQVNKAIDAATFVLQAPAGAKTVDLDQKAADAAPKATTLPAAVEYAQSQGWSLLQPTYLPTGSTLVGVTQLEKMMGNGVTLSYSSASTDFTITEANLGSDSKVASKMLEGLGDNYSGVTGAAPTEITVRGVQAKVFSPAGGGWTSLIWQEKGTGLYVVLHGKLTVDEATKIAEGLK